MIKRPTNQKVLRHLGIQIPLTASGKLWTLFSNNTDVEIYHTIYIRFDVVHGPLRVQGHCALWLGKAPLPVNRPWPLEDRPQTMEPGQRRSILFWGLVG